MNTLKLDCGAAFLLTEALPPYLRRNLTNLTFLPDDSLLGYAVAIVRATASVGTTKAPKSS